ncbi:uncharacterized protein LY89DRAFT_654396 [Mollisia scopiformis]|uniref:Sacsin/Nov domain-containing protein n=1 Tax=Mollisia scopiformis TaxID=149040 RepID=A0A194WVJ3_MOLSC|nr:uncharacterized protein LY89DRAFT_654396 [Mollisia scopiformis]KUJ11689.1 hypothetical protein LY89DRAFT_654396 [Mollisia scopiformis]
MDFSKLRATALQSANDEEAVTVNTRALIDKVLARYSGEWTTLRELIQNAADAQASRVKIKFESIPSSTIPLPTTTNASEILKHVLLNHTLQRLVVTNDGLPFGDNDWTRLKRIAEGNPDETKIGAFGVGFYSVFADCEEPFVSSGDQAMAFYWKGNALFTRKTNLPAEQTSRETNFVLDYRNTTTPMPNLLSISQFLATSLTFVALQAIELWVDDSKIISLQKKVSPGVEVPIPRSINTATKEGIMTVQSLERESVQMDATFMNVVGWKPATSVTTPKMPGSFDGAYGSSTNDTGVLLKSFFSRITIGSGHDKTKTKAMKEEKALQEIVLEDVTATTTVSVFLRVTTATVKTSVSMQFAEELERATKKPPPRITRPALLTASYDEAVASTEENAVAKGVDIFASVVPGKHPGGRVFIGFPTHQTTGAGMHLSAPSVIPTVERESIDLNARWVRTWNQEMLRAAGIMARLAFMNEMKDLSDDIKRAVERAGRGSKVSKVEIDHFTPRALHILDTFIFTDATPNPNVRHLIEEAFWVANSNPDVEIFSTRGVLSNRHVRLATEDFSGFVEGIPVIPKALVKNSFIQKLVDFDLISMITTDDVRKELSAKALSGDQLSQFIKWISHKAAKNEIDARTIHSLLDVAVATTSDAAGNGNVIALGTINNYLEVKKIPADVPIPPTCIPFEFSRASQFHEMQALGWQSLEIDDWLRHLVKTNKSRPAEQDYTKTTAFAANVLQILSKGWSGLKQESRDDVVLVLQKEAIVPSKLGIKKPGESYLGNVKLFDDLPNVITITGVKNPFLVELGVRKTVELDTVFNRLLATPAEGSADKDANGNRFMDLLKYLASVHDDIPAEDMKKLRNAKFCPAEAGPKGMESTKGTARKYSVKELFEPKDDLRQLGLPILRWPGPPGSYRVKSATGEFLYALGLRPFPSVPELIEMMASEAPTPGPHRAMDYFIANHHNNAYYQFRIGTTDKKFLPLEKASGSTVQVVSPTECFTNPNCEVFGFNILRQDLHIHANKFDVTANPNILECVNRLLASPPTDQTQATKVFEYLSSRLNELGQSSVAKIGDSRIVPVGSNKFGRREPFSDKMLTPRQCYIGTSSTYGEIFEFVDFGSNANAFLFKCGSKTEPTIIELATLACNEPARLLGVLQSPEKYMSLLRKLADEKHQLRKNKDLWKQMKKARFLLGEAEVSANDTNEKRSSQPPVSGVDQNGVDLDDNDAAPAKQYLLAIPSEIVVIDDFVSYRLFKSSLVTAVEDEKLEDFYMDLGSPALSVLVKTSLSLGQRSEKQDSAVQMQNHVLERAKLFLHELKREEIKHDYRWLEKNLKVEVVSAIELRRSLASVGVSHREKRAAACEYTGSSLSSQHTLYITGAKSSLYQISTSICKLILERAGQSHMITFEQFLTLSLIDLKNRGYNVDRILRIKAAERRIAEEERQKQLVLEQERIRHQENLWNQRQQQMSLAPVANPEDGQQMPGSFGADSPENSPTPIQQDKSRFSLSNFVKRGGMSGLGSFGQHLQKQLGGGSSGSPSQEHDEVADVRKSVKPQPQKLKQGEIERVTSPAAVSQNLASAIAASRPHNSDHLFSQPTTAVVKEQETYCDSASAQNVVYLADTANSTRMFIDKDHPAHQEFLRQNVQSLNDFAVLLHEICAIYNLNPITMHIFYDPAGNTIAFNSNGSIFCNYRYFLQLHKENLADGRGIAGAYWWVVVAHELAHNLVSSHDSQHGFYTENMIAQYFPRMMEQVRRWNNDLTKVKQINQRINQRF